MPTLPEVMEMVEVLSDSVYTDVVDAAQEAFQYASYAAAAARAAVELSQSESTNLMVVAVPLSGQ